MLIKRTINQIIKNHQNDLENSSGFQKSLTYLNKNKIPLEEAFGIIVENRDSLKGLPLFLIKENKIENYLYTYKGLSINVLIEAYNQNDYKISYPKEYKLNEVDYKFLTKILLSIKDEDILLNIFKDNKKILLSSFKEITPPSEYEDDFNNYFSYLEYFISKEKSCKYQQLFNVLLYNIEWSKKEINHILYGTNEDNDYPFIQKVINSYEFETFKKIVDKYGFDYEKSVPDQYSYYYVPIVPQLFFIDDRFEYNQPQINKFEISKKFLDLFIKLNIPLFPKEMLKQTRSKDIIIDKMFNGESKRSDSVGTISRGYYTTSKDIKNMIEDENKDDSKSKGIALLKYYIEKTNTLEVDNHFWSLTLVSNKELNSMLLEFNKTINKEWSYEEVRNALKNAIYSNKPENIHDVLKDNKKNLELLHKKNKFGKTMFLEILQETDSGIIKEKLFELCKILLDYGYRINNHYDEKDFYEGFTFKNLGIQDGLKKLCKEYPQNYKEYISFKIEQCFSASKSFSQIEEVTKEFLRILKIFNIENIDKIYFDKVLEDNVIYFCPSLNKTISFNLNLLNGSELTKEDIKMELI